MSLYRASSVARSTTARLLSTAHTHRGLTTTPTQLQRFASQGRERNSNAKFGYSAYIALGAASLFTGSTLLCESQNEKPPFPLQRAFRDPAKEDSFPIMSLAKVREDHGNQVWVTMDGGVYNVTPFLEAHPGGVSRLQMVNGSDLKEYWEVYKLHNRNHIRCLLEEYRIGTLSPADTKEAEDTSKFSSYYDTDPVRPRAKELRIPSEHPWNSEPQAHVLVDQFFTPNDLFFVRNHNNVPVIDENEWTLEIEGNDAIGVQGRSFTLQELRENFPRHEVVSALQCAGNRQEDFVTADRPLFVAPHWRNGAIGNAEWAGVKVRDLLRACGMEVDRMALGESSTGGMKIVNFIASDEDETGVPYAGVIPVEKVVDPFGDAILAYEMNGETLPRDHGYPVRLLAPGHAGCRNVKWVKQISVSAEPSELDAGSRLDRHFAPNITWDEHKKLSDPRIPIDECKARIDQAPVIQTLPVQSIIGLPYHRSVLSGDSDCITIKGVAWSGAGRGICRVEVSIDGGNTWTSASLSQGEREAPKAEQGMGRNWAWHMFQKEIPLPQEIRRKLRNGEKVELEVVSKAIDGDFNSQPEKMKQTWNVLGICVNHWPRSLVTLDPTLRRGQEVIPEVPEAGSCIWPNCKPHDQRKSKSSAQDQKSKSTCKPPATEQAKPSA